MIESTHITKRVKEILSCYEGASPGILTNIARLLMSGRLKGTGRLVILPVDQGFAILSGSFWKDMFSDVENLLLPFFVGNLILSVAAGMIAYVVMRRILVRHRARHEAQEANAS